MKLLKPASCPRESGRGNVKSRTALGEASFVRSSDRGSTPLGSIPKKTPNHRGFGRFSFEPVYTLVYVFINEARKASAKIDRLYERYDQVSAAAGLDKQYSRAYVRGYRQTKAGNGFTIRADNGIIKSVDKPTISRINSPIEQRNSGKGNPNAILHFDRPLNRRQTALLDALPEFDSRTTVKKSNVNMRDLAALTAQTGCEYAMFTRKGERLIIRGNGYMTNINAETARKMATDGWRWSGHTHPGVDFLCTQPSDGDYTILEQFFHNNSVIYNSRGEFRTYERKRPR